jgi:endonuclease/exonuclease/phosphatase (EEP) superfamily protein YafD
MPAPRKLRRWILVALAGVCAATVAAWLAPLGWPFELFSHFRPQFAVTAAVLVPALVLTRAPRAALLATGLAALLFLPSARRLLADVRAPACGAHAFVVVTVNVEYSNDDPRRFLDWVARHPADVIVVQEVTPQWAEVLATLGEYPHRWMVTRADPYGIAMLSRWPFEKIDAVDLAGDGIPSLDAIVQVNGQRIHVLGLHTRWPITPGLARLRDRALLRAAVLAREQSLPTVVAGDLNLAPDSSAFAQLLQTSGLRDALAGQGWHPTWMAGFWPLALRIDHQLVSPSLCVEQVEVGAEIGSDHRPVIARYRLPQSSPRA